MAWSLRLQQALKWQREIIKLKRCGGNPGSPQEDSAQPAEIAEPMELKESMERVAEREPLEITLPVNPLSSSSGCTLRCDELQSENRQLRKVAKKEVATQK